MPPETATLRCDQSSFLNSLCLTNTLNKVLTPVMASILYFLIGVINCLMSLGLSIRILVALMCMNNKQLMVSAKI